MAKAASSNFRTDIEGLRGLAITLVVFFHVFVGKVSAGVDVFLLLGGIFFFSSQLANARNKNGLTFLQSLMRIIRRLFPLLAVVVAATLAGSLFVMNKLVHSTMAEDALAALGYYINWQLAFSGREYTSVRDTVSPFQHLWSMSAQLQIYAASLVVVVLIAFIFRKFSRAALLVVLTAATVLSFIYACVLHGDDQSLNYYSTVSRFWEIGLGGLLGMLLLRRGSDGRPLVPPMGRVPRWILGIVGLCAIIGTGIFLDGAHQFPGPWTLIPLIGATLVVLAGTGGQPVGVTRLLETPLFQFLGRISYALYLWHWPILVLVVAYMGQSTASNPAEATDPGVSGTSVKPIVGIGVMCVSVALAWITAKIVEKPLRQERKPSRSWILINPRYWWNSLKIWPKTVYAVVILLLAGMVVASPGVIERRTQAVSADLAAAAQNRSLYPGAGAFLYNQRAPEGLPLAPALDDFDGMLPPSQTDGCYIGFDSALMVTHKNFNESPEECAYGDVNSQRTLYAVGGSHSEHLIPALDIMGKNLGIKIKPLIKMGCPLGSTIPKYTGEDYPSCREWSDFTINHILQFPPTEGVIMTGTRPSSYRGTGPEVVPEEYVDTVRRFSEAGIHSYLVRDNAWIQQHDQPLNQLNVRKCVSESLDGTYEGADHELFTGAADPDAPTTEELEKINEICGTVVERSLLPVSPQYQAYQGLDVSHIDLTNAYCRDGRCPAVIGNVLVYRDGHHFTNLFAQTLAPELQRQYELGADNPPLPPLQPFETFPDVPEQVQNGAVPGTKLDGAAGEDAPANPGLNQVPDAPKSGRILGELGPDVWSNVESEDSAPAGNNTGGATAGGAAGEAPASTKAPQQTPPTSPYGPLKPYWDPSVNKYYDPNTGYYLP
ncbi:acyltransferase family protein [Corynebacterium anserum]|uniref:Acyltransferase family protein n=1 Tax=Corynebacterium anserum TaxID=2684406 RepID=A0A7G7YLI0_9CORY|nr:acyltransferase family protein [Corynebacterium anserum]QNH95350.1 acyltransferase family protein [Corynebacterium anserum]